MLSSVICAFFPSRHHHNEYFLGTYYVLGILPGEVTERTPCREGRAVTEAGTVFLAQQMHRRWHTGKRQGFRERRRSLPGKTGLGGEGGSRQRSARPGAPRVWNPGSQVGGSQGKVLNPLHFISLGSDELLLCDCYVM